LPPAGFGAAPNERKRMRSSLSSTQIGPRFDIRTSASTAAAYIVYQGIAIAFFGIPVLSDLSHSYIATPGAIDPSGYMWFLVWWPYAVSHHLNPLFSDFMWAPTGFNVMWAQSIPLPSLAIYPITRMYGPVTAWNILMLIAPALAALGVFIVCRHLTNSALPSFIGGYIFGFSPYFLGQLQGHLSLMLLFPVPFAIYAVLLRLDRRLTATGLIAILAALMVVQFLCCNEILASSMVLGMLVLVTAILTMKDRRDALCEIGVLTAIATGFAAIFLSPFLFYAFFAGFPHGSIYLPRDFSSDLLGFVIPTETVVGGSISALRHFTSRFVGGISEATRYVGIAFLLLIIVFGITSRRDPRKRIVVLALVIAAVASLGPKLHIAGIKTVPLPWALFTYLPLIDKALPARFTAYVFLALGIMTAIYLATDRHRSRWIMAGAGLLTFFPNYHFQWRSRVDTPRFFSSGLFRERLKQGETTLIFPYGRLGNSMLWQAQGGMYFRMAGGWVPVTPPEFSRWPLLQTFYGSAPGIDFDLQLRSFLADHNVRAIILSLDSKNRWSRLLQPLRLPASIRGDVIEYQVPDNALKSFGKVPVDSVIRRVAMDSFSALLIAANRYIAAGFPLAKLTPREAQRLGYLQLPLEADSDPDSPFPQWWQNLWLGKWGPMTGVGIVGDYKDLEPLTERYGRYAAGTFFPFPKKLTQRREHGSGQLLMVFTPEGLERAAQAGGHLESGNNAAGADPADGVAPTNSGILNSSAAQ
jgi:hypothetical protein